MSENEPLALVQQRRCVEWKFRVKYGNTSRNIYPALKS